MTSVEIRVELPSHSHSFIIQVHSECSILQVKEEIFRTCMGAPRVDGQRLLWRGRYLIDHEKVEGLWKSHDEPRIVHLAVHPSAWSSTPPGAPRSTQPSLAPTPTPTVSQTVLPSMSSTNSTHNPLSPAHQLGAGQLPLPLPSPLVYVQARHDLALYVLSHGQIPQEQPDAQALNGLKALAKQFVEASGYAWADILNANFPSATPGGLRYVRVDIDGQPYLTLLDPAARPTPIQVHALKLLAHTFPLLSLSSQAVNTARILPSHSTPLPMDINHLLQQLELPPLRLAPDRNAGANGAARILPIRPLMFPLLFLAVRVALILYFVAPARKPMFGVMLLGWLVWEMWVPFQLLFLRRPPQAPNDQPRNPQGVPDAQPENAPENGGGQARVGGQRPDRQPVVLLNHIGDMNIQAEEQLLNPTPGAALPEPGLGQRAAIFFGLLITTIHPAVWNRRRVALRQREGRVRMEASVRAPTNPEGDAQGPDSRRQEQRAQMRAEMEAQHSRRPGWVQRYIQRVIDSDWVDDAD